MMMLIGYLVIGVVLLLGLLKGMRIDWNAEGIGTKLLLIATPVAWPIVLVIIIFVFVQDSGK